MLWCCAYTHIRHCSANPKTFPLKIKLMSAETQNKHRQSLFGRIGIMIFFADFMQ